MTAEVLGDNDGRGGEGIDGRGREAMVAKVVRGIDGRGGRRQ